MEDKKVISILRLLFNSTVVKYGNKIIELAGEEGYNSFQSETANGRQLVQAFGLKTIEDVFYFMNDVNGIQWKREADSFVTGFCPTAVIGKQMNAKPTCKGCCLIPLNSMVQAIEPSVKLEMQQTIWETGKPCIFDINRK